MKMNLHYFSWVREIVGKDAERRELDDVETVGDVLSALEHADPTYAEAFADRSRLRFAVDRQMVGVDAPVCEGTELAIFPPVTGG